MKNSGLDIHDFPSEQRAIGYQWINNAYKNELILESGAFDPLGDMWTTAENYGQYLSWMMAAWPARDERATGAIARSAVRSMTETVHMMGAYTVGGADCESAAGYAMGLAISDHCKLGLVIGHGGGFPGYGSYVLMAPEKGFAVFAFTNNTYASVQSSVW